MGYVVVQNDEGRGRLIRSLLGFHLCRLIVVWIKWSSGGIYEVGVAV
jgi:hypothetical protein